MNPLPRKVEHFRDFSGSNRLRETMQVGCKANNVAALVARCEVGPLSGLQVDLERTQLPVVSLGIERHPLVPLTSTVGQPASHDQRQTSQRRASNEIIPHPPPH
jgi:hypothetical protein